MTDLALIKALKEDWDVETYDEFLELDPPNRLMLYQNGKIPPSWAARYDREGYLIADACEEFE